MRIPAGSPASKPTRLRRSQLDTPIVGAYDGVYAPAYRYPGFSLDKMLGLKGYQFVEDMLQMAACRAPFDLKRYAVLQDGWSVEAAVTDPGAPRHSQAQEMANAVTWALQNIRDPETDLTQDLKTVLFDMMMGAWTGNRTAEIEWQYQASGPLKGRHGLRAIYVKPCKQIGFDLDERTLAIKNITSYTPGGGYDFDIPVEKCLLYVHNQSAGNPQGVGDWRACYKHWFRLDENVKFWADALERWGAPVLIMVYPAGSANDLEIAQTAADRIRQGSSPIVPNNVTYELVTAPRSVFVGMERAAIWDTQQIALNINSNILTTGIGQNSLALGQVHQSSGQTVYDALSRQIEAVFTQQVIRRFVRYNYGDEALEICPRLRLRKEPEGNSLQIAQMLQILMQGGNMPGRSRVIREQLGLPPLDPEEEKLLDAEAKAQEEAQSMLADARLSNQTAPMSEVRAREAVEMLTRAIYARDRLRSERQ